MNIDPKLEAIANKVIDKMNVEHTKRYGSVILILMVIGIILSLIRVIQECNANKTVSLNTYEQNNFVCSEIRTVCIKKNIFTQWRLKKIIKQKLSPEDYKEYGLSLQKAIMDTGINITEEETSTLIEAAYV